MSEKPMFLVIEGDRPVVNMMEALFGAEGCSIQGLYSVDEVSKILESPPVGVFDAVILGDPPSGYFYIYGEIPKHWLNLALQIKKAFPGVPLIVFSNDGIDWRGYAENIIQKPNVDDLKKNIIAIKKKKERNEKSKGFPG